MRKLNEMMDRPVIDSAVRDYLRQEQKQLTGKLADIERFANENRVPIIPHETVTYFIWLFNLIKPKQILEIGTAIGFSAALMVEHMHEDGHVTTIDRNPDMYERAEALFAEMAIEDRVTLMKGQANEILAELPADTYDFIFMDSAKAKYYSFFPDCMRVLQQGGVLAVDDVLQGGTILDSKEDVPKYRRKIHRKLNDFLEVVLDHPALDTTLLPLGDGLLLITKKEVYDFDFMRQD